MKKHLSCLLMAVLLLGFPGTAAARLAPGDFLDIHGHWAEQEIQTACNLGFMNGTGTNAQGYIIFAPQATVTHAQLAVALQRVFELDYGKIRFFKQPLAGDYFWDVDNNSWYSDALVMCAVNQVFAAGTEFKPDVPATRMEVAQTIKRCFDAKGISVPMIMMMPEFKDTGDLVQSDINAVVFVNNTGIMTGNEGYFRPRDTVRRGELAKVLNRCAQLMVVDENYNGQEYRMKTGQTLTLSLAANQTTGFAWTPANDWDAGVLALLGEDYLAEGNSKLVGQGGRRYFRFQALKPGTVALKLYYARPWESVPPAQTFTLKVAVTDKDAVSGLKLDIKEVKETSDLIDIDLNIPRISGLQDERIQSAVNETMEKAAADLRNTLTAEVAEFKKECDQSGYPFRKYGLVTRCPQYYENGSILSFYVDYYSYTGGAHGSTLREAYNYDLASGKMLSLNDLFNEGYDFKSIINQKISQEISTHPQDFFTDTTAFQSNSDKSIDGGTPETPPVRGFAGISDVSCYYLQENSLVIFFQQYEIAPYAAGIPEFIIPLADLGAGLKVKL